MRMLGARDSIQYGCCGMRSPSWSLRHCWGAIDSQYDAGVSLSGRLDGIEDC